MIRRFKIDNLNGNEAWNFDFELFPDINVFTGKNGAGKTTVLKLLWYLVSGNIERVYPEITFSSALVEGDNFRLQIALEPKGKATIEWVVAGNSQTAPVQLGSPVENETILRIDKEIATASGSSVFFPTFRRIEGGFSLSRPRARFRRANAIQEGMNELSEELSYLDHLFVSSISTDDLESLLTEQLAKTSEATNNFQADLSKYIETIIREWDEVDSDNLQGSLDKARAILSDIKKNVQQIESARIALVKPFTVLTTLVSELLKHKGVSVKDVITFGDVSTALEAGHLSAGEKQMLSFLCYNAFEKKGAIFIDEPEISLHVDWQRILFPKLMEQASDNQFIVSTHSPFIYSKYSDREIVLNADKGSAE